MQVQVEQMDYFHETRHTYTLLNYFLRTFAINCVLTPGVPFLHLLKIAAPVTLIGIFDLYSLIYKSLYIMNVQVRVAPSVQYMDAVQTIFDLFQYFVDIWYVYKYGVEDCLQYINRYSYMDRLLGMKYFSYIRGTSTKFLCFIFTSWFVTCLYDYLIWAWALGPILPLYFVGLFIHMLIKLLTNVHLSLNTLHVESRLRTVGDQIQTLYDNSENQIVMSQEAISSTLFSSRSHSTKAFTEFLKAKKNVKWFRCYYILLLDQVQFINRIFGMRILLNSLSLLIEMVRLINLSVKVIMGSNQIGAKFYPAIGSLAKVLLCGVLLISMVWRSERAYEQRNRLLILIDNLFVIKKIDDSIVDEIKDFQALLRAHPISFSMAYFVRIDNSFLVSTASAVVTYTIILLQSIH